MVLLTLSVGILFGSCEEVEVTEETPKCVEKIIRKIQRDEVRNPPAEVWCLEVNSSIYYYVPPYCCDALSKLYDTDCNLICAPDGGLTGGGSGSCPDLDSAVWGLIWEDDREYN